MAHRRFVHVLILVAAFIAMAAFPPLPQDWGRISQTSDLIVGRNVNMVAGQDLFRGDPYLQRQNEPSMTVIPNNPLHMFAAANDYRLVDYPESEGPLPGIPEGATASQGDAWMGIFKSYNGGVSWTNALLPGHLFDNSTQGQNSPIKGFGAAADPTVRAGASGLVLTSGIAFNRVKNGRSVIFVARYFDTNAQAIGDMDSIKYLDTTVIDEGTSGQFADKPWLALDIPRNPGDTVPISVMSSKGPLQTQSSHIYNIPRYNAYIVYSIFLGSEQGNPHSKIMFAKSSDCGNNWDSPIKLSEGVHVCQGTNIAVSPVDGKIYVMWRQYERLAQGVPNAIVMCSSDDFGNTFTKAKEIALIDPFDQYTGGDRFRTSTFPALAIDHNGLIYVAYSQTGIGPNGEARIVIATSKTGKKWASPTPIDNHSGGGHQIMPSLIFNGMLKATWIDTRKSLGFVDQNGNYHHDDNIADPGPTGLPHTLDTWVAHANPSNPNSGNPQNPVFFDSTQVSRYIYEAKTDSSGQLVNPPVIFQAQHNFANLPIFVGGSAPFIGDYLDITSAPAFLFDYQAATWRFNTGERPFDPSLSHIVFPCNRDVIWPKSPATWMSYQPPGPGCLDDLTAGSRNQNIYTAPITDGIFTGSPVNTKPLENYRRTFLIFAKNLTDYDKLIRLTIDAPNDMDVSFWEELEVGGGGTPPADECPFERCGDRVVELYVLAHSAITLTVFVDPYYDPLASFRVKVEEIDAPYGNPTGHKSAVVLNPDPVITQTIPPTEEIHIPAIIIEDPILVEISDPTMLSDLVVYSPYYEELLNFSNPDIVAPGIRHPGIRHDNIINPGIRHTAVGSIPNGEVTDLNWTVKNDGTATSAFSFDAIGETPSVPHQLLIYRVASTPSSEDCQLTEEEHHELLLTIENPGIRHPGIRHPGIRHPGIRHNTFFLAPGEEAIVTLRLIDDDPSSGSGGSRQSGVSGNSQNGFDPHFYAKTVAGAAIPQASTGGVIETASFMWIYTTTLPDGSVFDPYPETQLEAEGGIGAYSWALVPGYGNLPPGLELTTDGIIRVINGSPEGKIGYDPPYENNEKVYNFAVQATDYEGQTVYRSLSIKVILKVHTITATAGLGGTIDPSGDVLVVHGSSQSFSIVPDDCYEVDDVLVDGVSQGNITSYEFTNVLLDHTIDATFKKITYTITATVGDNGSISPSGAVVVDCGSSQTLAIQPAPCHMVADVLVDNTSVGPVTTYTFGDIRADHTIHATFALIPPSTVVATAGELDGGNNFVEYENGSGLGGSISPSGDVSVNCGESQTFTIATNEGYLLVDVIVDGVPAAGIVKGPEVTYPFNNVSEDHSIQAIFKKIESWVRRYNNGPVNDNDEANDIDFVSGKAYVTGFSIGNTTGPDYFTIGYDGEGNETMIGRYDGPSHEGDKAYTVVADSVGNVYVGGASIRGQPRKHSDYALVKYDIQGEEAWDAKYDAQRNGHDVITDAALDDAELYVYITGRSEDSVKKNSEEKQFDYYTIKYDAQTGNEIWGMRYNNNPVNGHDEAIAIAIDSSGNAYVTGRSQGNNNLYDCLTVKYDSSGREKWVKRMNHNPAIGNAEGTAITVKGGLIYVVGKVQSSNTGYDFFLIKYDTDGNMVGGVKTYNNSIANGDDGATAIAIDDEGNAFVSGYSSNGSDDDYLTLKYDKNGDFEWDVRFDSEIGHDVAVDIAADSSGGIYVTGRSQGFMTDVDYFTIKYDNAGNLIWRVRYNNIGRDGIDEPRAMVIDPDGNIYVTGRSEGNGTNFDYATVKYEQY
jgi:hypothetical protein